MYQPCFQQLTIKDYSCTDTPGTSSTSFNGVHSLLSAFFLSPYPLTLRLDKVTFDSSDPLAINTEQQSKSLDVARVYLYTSYIVLKSLKIRSNDAFCLFSKVKSIKVDKITIDIDTDTNTHSLRSLLSIVSANDMTVSINEINLPKIVIKFGRPILLEIIFNSLSQTKPCTLS
ncbi:PREDICTED: uncharacterized protein LOC109586440 [Amphimedon queenslandica]|uniref:Uncharacterized protein n=1 Tax=Amphimedon queenslandica TaxID=400682 RepID=A0AAN0JMG6_AMPQE|nr:PREDICTED: uncharacterized protein LOC109586440 [Amphimedon queenslandica]|eukprot:XP_019858185.1 PREDICTED: uncharacterized protein LOC109586440 [Amphimedon queenslandica]